MSNTRLRMSWEQEFSLLQECNRRGATKGYQKILGICDWSFKELGLPKKTAYKTVFKIIREKEKIEFKAHSTHHKMESDLTVQSARLESDIILGMADVSPSSVHYG